MVDDLLSLGKEYIKVGLNYGGFRRGKMITKKSILLGKLDIVTQKMYQIWEECIKLKKNVCIKFGKNVSDLGKMFQTGKYCVRVRKNVSY